jgi:hypothetical protein
MNNTQESTSNFLEKLDDNKLSGSSDTLVLCAYLEEENEKEDKKISYFSFKNYRSKSCIIL